eukprot:CAMPEP_0177592810 /NCGR_PEP_ID=MMETSP0419_2-20121207/8767_1 /TAXON_ID=582737 /ORGANISM="Tetraselmis sp., Strain GSL018" /LENGTH=199 /DNA_ID=CAMNT_0019083719 /DNA_START=343 /DNA_END=941 /DNA_ORIENTATION=+
MPLSVDHALRVELHALDVGEPPVAAAHDGAVRRPRRHLKVLGNARLREDEAVVSRGLERVRKALEDTDVFVEHGGRLPVHHAAGGADDVGAKDLPDALVAHADAEDRDPEGPEPLDDLEGDPRVLRAAGPGRHEDAGGLHLKHLVDRLLVVLQHNVLAAQVAEVLAEIVREAVVVINYYNAALCRTRASSLAARSRLEG